MLKKIIPFISIIFVSIYLPTYIYTKNVDKVLFFDVLPVLIVFCAISALVFTIFLLITKNVVKSSLSAIIFIIIITNYKLLEGAFNFLLPMLNYWHVLPIFLVVSLHIVYFIYIKTTNKVCEITINIICITIGSLVIFNFILAAPSIIKTVRLAITEADDKMYVDSQKANDSPNIYYLLLDEYSSFDVIEQYYNYDNTEFANWLEAQGFFVSYNSSNESSDTTTVVTNYVNLEYLVNDETSSSDKSYLRKNSKLVELMSLNGYKIIGLGDSMFIGIDSMTGGNGGGANTIEGLDFQQVVLNYSVIYPFIINESDSSLILDSFDYFNYKNNYADEQTFTVMYLVTPHEPFIFDENGGSVLPRNYNNWDDKEFYLGQYIYITKLIKQAVSKIIENDPNSIIVLQSDHSARFVNGIVANDRQKILNAVYYPSKDISKINAKSGVNTWRLVINQLFDMNLNIVEVDE